MKISNIYKCIGAIAAAASITVSCTDDVKFGNAFIEKAPGGTVTLDTVFNSATYAQQFLTALYAKQYYGLPFSSSTGVNSHSPYTGKFDALTDIYQLHWSSTAVFGNYYQNTMNSNKTPLMGFSNEMVWEVVRNCILLEENIDKVPGLSEDEKKYMLAQEKCIRASRYFDLFMHYGGLPIITKAFTGQEDMNIPRSTVEETVNYMVSLLDEATPHLLWAYNGNTSETNATQTGRWTKAGAMALKAKILLFAASPMFNADQPYMHADGTFKDSEGNEKDVNLLWWYGNYDAKRWDTALAAFEAFFKALNDNGYYELWQADLSGKTTDQAKSDAYRQAFRMGYISETSKEVLHSTRVATVYGSQGTYCWWSWGGMGTAPTSRNIYSPTEEYVEMFPWKDGMPFNWDTDYAAGKIAGTINKTTGEVSDPTKGKLFIEYKAVRGGFTKAPSRDPRLYENACVTGQQKTLDWSTGTSSGNIFELWVGGQDASFNVANDKGEIVEALTTTYPNGYGQLKYLLGEEFHRKYMHWVVLSLNEMYLMYAEALAQTDKLDEAMAQVDIVRKRVGLGGLKACNSKLLNATSNPSLTKEQIRKNLIEEILRERACELGLSNNRFFDMIRYKRTDWMTKKLHGLITYRLKKNSAGKYVRNLRPYIGDDKDNGEAEPNAFEYQRFELNQPAGGRVLWQYQPTDEMVVKYLLSPFPQTELNKGYGLVQNPGW